MKTCVILNPMAGRGLAGQRRFELEAALRGAGIAYELLTTRSRGGATELAAQAVVRGYETVIAVGGDGTINEVLNGLLAGAEGDAGAVALGVLPLGTGSDFVKMLDGFDADLASIARRLAAGNTRPIDIGQITVETGGRELRRAFINGLGAGIDARVAVEVASVTWATGLAAYMIASLRALANYRPSPMTVQYDGRELHRRLYFATVANGRWQGGGFLLTPGASLDDGALDLCIVPKLRLDQVIRYYPKLFDGSHTELKMVTTAQARQITISGAAPFPVATDGEVVTTDATHVTVETLPGALRLLV
jgi:YegS/Rv2252/BmrU family lipid kinase